MGADVPGPDDPREKFESVKPRVGGNPEPIKFSAKQEAILKAVADQIIPPGGGFPAPSEVGVVEDFMARYVTPSGQEAKWYPFVAEKDFKSAVDALGDGFLSADANKKVEVLKRLEVDSTAFFTQLRDMVYFGYYSRPAVVRAIQENLEAGRDYHGPPQPYGYLTVTEKWDDSMIPRGRGGYTKTKDIKPVKLEGMSPKKGG